MVRACDENSWPCKNYPTRYIQYREDDGKADRERGGGGGGTTFESGQGCPSPDHRRPRMIGIDGGRLSRSKPQPGLRGLTDRLSEKQKNPHRVYEEYMNTFSVLECSSEAFECEF